MAGDPLSAFGSVLGLNRPMDAATAEVFAAPGLFVEAIVAPRFRRRRPGNPHHRAEVEGQRAAVGGRRLGSGRSRLGRYRCLDGGVLMQEADVLPDPEDIWQVVTDAQPTDAQLADLRFAWELVRHVKSNAIVVCKDRMLLGAGAGQMSRVDSTEIAMKKAGDRARRRRARLRRLLSLPRLDRLGGRGRRDGRHPARRLEERRSGVAACNRYRIADDLHRPAALQTLTTAAACGFASRDQTFDCSLVRLFAH